MALALALMNERYRESLTGRYESGANEICQPGVRMAEPGGDDNARAVATANRWERNFCMYANTRMPAAPGLSCTRAPA